MENNEVVEAEEIEEVIEPTIAELKDSIDKLEKKLEYICQLNGLKGV